MKVEMKTFHTKESQLKNIYSKTQFKVGVVAVNMQQLSAHMNDPFNLYLLVDTDRVYYMGQDIGYFKSEKDYKIDNDRLALAQLQARQRGILG